MRVTTWTEYSLIITLNLAKRRVEGAGVIAAREIAETERLPADYVEQILLKLRRAELVESTRGAKGGYALSKEPAEITVFDVMSAAENQTFELPCHTHPVDAPRCIPDEDCTIRPVWVALKARIDDLLSSVTLADLLVDESRVTEFVTLRPMS